MKAADARLLASLGNVIRNSDSYDELIEDCKGSGRALAVKLAKLFGAQLSRHCGDAFGRRWLLL